MPGRLDSGGAVDRSRPVTFTFDGKPLQGVLGDTIASALLANGVRIVGRSFKYHRPRGIWGSWVEEPNAIFDVRSGEAHRPNVRATTEPLGEGMEIRAVNAEPTAERDRFAFIDRLSRFIPAGFYYKTFMWPDWHRFEPRIRRMAGLGRLDPDFVPGGIVEQVSLHCDVLVIGAGPAGLAAAATAVAAGRSVVLADDRPAPGGSLLAGFDKVEAKPADEWIAAQVAAIRDGGGVLLASTTAFGVYDHGLVCLDQRQGDGRPDRLLRVRARQVVLAAGAIERPLLHANNDRPGVMSAEAALDYLARYGVLAGERIVIATNHDGAYRPARWLRKAGASVTVLDARPRDVVPAGRDFEILAGEVPLDVVGVRAVTAVRTKSRRIDCDLLAVSGGYSPTVHLHCQAGGRLRWEERLAAFRPDGPLQGLRVVGAANGTFGTDAAVAEGRAPFGGAEAVAGRTYTIMPLWGPADSRKRIWVDFQNDVTTRDIAIAARENFRSVEHLKRYTTLGMATDQGKTSNVNGLATMAVLSRRSVGEVGTTTFRPPYVPVPLSTIAGWRGGEFMNPVRRLPLENAHREAGATFREYGGWLRPAWFGGGNPVDAIRREAEHARERGAFFDASTLGKIEVIGPDAAAFLDFQYYNTMSTLAPGRIRYGFMLTEGGVVYDDGVLARLAEDRFIISCSSSHVAGVHARLEAWRQDIFDPRRIQVHNATSQWATVTVTGPGARDVVAELDLGVSLDDNALPHMAIAAGEFEGGPARVARVSFTGDRSYEISVPSGRAGALWWRVNLVATAFGMIPVGLEAVSLMRAEKGFIIIGKDTDGTTMPQDLGVVGPRERKQVEYLGKRSLFTDTAMAPDRRQFVGLAALDAEGPLPTGAHGIERTSGGKRSIGYVTSSYFSPVLRRPIALGLIENGIGRHGEEIVVQHLGKEFRARIVPPCFLDPENERLNQ